MNKETKEELKFTELDKDIKRENQRRIDLIKKAIDLRNHLFAVITKNISYDYKSELVVIPKKDYDTFVRD